MAMVSAIAASSFMRASPSELLVASVSTKDCAVSTSASPGTIRLTSPARSMSAAGKNSPVIINQAARAGPKIQLVVALLLVPSVLLLVAAALVPALTGASF